MRQLSPGCTVHYNWEVIRPEFFQRFEAPPAALPQVVFMGGTQVMKGFREALAALNIVRQQVDMKLVITGRASATAVQRAVHQLGLRHVSQVDVKCRGLLTASTLAQLFSESLGLLHPSYVDNSPNSVCEAQVAGLPVIAADVGGVRSLIEDEVTGLLCTLNPADIARQVLRLYHDPALRQRLARQATAVARPRHDPAVIVARTLATYQAVLADFRKA